jgi:hypothetical protein
MMKHLRKNRITAFFFWGWLLAGAEFRAQAEAQAQGVPLCSELLSLLASDEAGLDTGPESALADAWAEIVFAPDTVRPDQVAVWAQSSLLDQGSASEKPQEWISTALNPPPGIFTLPEEEGLSRLRGVAEWLEAQDRLDRRVLAEHIEARAREALVGREVRGEIEEESKDSRRRAAEPIRRMHAGSRVAADVLRTRSGNLVVSARSALVFFAPDGSVIRRVPMSGDVDASAVQVSDGRVLVGTGDGVLAAFDEVGNLLSSRAFEIRPLSYVGGLDAPGAELADGTFVIGGLDGWVYLLAPDGSVNRFQTEGEIHTAALPLTDGGGVVGSDDGVWYFFNSRGKVIRKVETSGSIARMPVRLHDGNLMVVSHQGSGMVLSVKGKVLARFEVGMAPTSPVQLPDGRIALASWHANPSGGWESRIDFLRPDGIAAAPFVTSAVPVLSNLTLLSNGHVAFVDSDAVLHFLDVNGGAHGREVLVQALEEKVYSGFLELPDGTMVAGTEQGTLVFVREADLLAVTP